MKAVGFGCVVWDDISEDHQAKGPQNIGGTIFNTVVHLNRLGDKASIITAIGDDDLGTETIQKIEGLGIGLEFVKLVPEPTCLVKVFLDEDKNWSYSMEDRVSWDYISVDDADTDDINRPEYDAFFFGTLEQRNTVSRKSLIKVLEECKFDTILLDLNLRPPFLTKEIVDFSLKKCTIAKMNMEEAIMANKMLDIEADSIDKFITALNKIYSIGKTVITDRKNGAYFGDGETTSHSSGYSIDLVDPVGAGDAFSAGLLHKLGQGHSLGEACDFANRVGAVICSARSSIPDYTMDDIHKLAKSRDPEKTIPFLWQ